MEEEEEEGGGGGGEEEEEEEEEELIVRGWQDEKCISPFQNLSAQNHSLLSLRHAEKNTSTRLH